MNKGTIRVLEILRQEWSHNDDRHEAIATAIDAVNNRSEAEQFVIAVADMVADKGQITNRSITKPGYTLKRHALDIAAKLKESK